MSGHQILWGLVTALAACRVVRSLTYFCSRCRMHRLRGAEWDAMRALVLERDGHACTVAKYDPAVRCAPGPLHVHEIDRDGDPRDPGIYSAACSAHHARWHHLIRQNEKRAA